MGPPNIGSHFSKGVLFQDENIFSDKTTTESPYDKHSISEVTRWPSILDTKKTKRKYDSSSVEESIHDKVKSPYDKSSSREKTRRPVKNANQSAKKNYDYSSTRRPNLYSSVLFHTRKPPVLDDPYEKFWSRKKSRKKDNYLRYETTEYPEVIQDTTEYPEIIQYTTEYPDIVLDDPKDKYLFTPDRPPPPPSPPS